MVNGLHPPSTASGPKNLIRDCLIALTRALQYYLSCAYVHSSRHDLCAGASINMSPSCLSYDSTMMILKLSIVHIRMHVLTFVRGTFEVGTCVI